ncbi:unnamed protein product, partial [Rotaria sp. Silwood2]
MDSKF